MPIELLCKGCSRKLRVGDEHAGKHARCPQCGEINPILVPGAAETTYPAPAATDGATGAGTPSGFATPRPEFGSAPAPTSDNPFARPVAGGPGNPGPTGAGGFAWTPPPGSGAAPNPFSESAAPFSINTGPTPTYVPHRGGMILAFGLLGWFFCFIFAILAWVWGADDLRKMKRGYMDPSGMGTTQAGMILGIIVCALHALGLLAFVFIIIVSIIGG